MKAKNLIRHPGTLQVTVSYEEAGGNRNNTIASILNTIDRSDEEWVRSDVGAAPLDGRVLWVLDDETEIARMYMKMGDAT